MALAGIIEYMASLERKTGGLVCSQAHRQDLIVGFPANTTVYYQTTPGGGLYANIVYWYSFGNMVPDVFSYSLNYTGTWVSQGVLTSDILAKTIDFFMVITAANPISLYITNRDLVPHAWEANLYYLTVGSIDDMRLLAEAVADRGGMSHYLYQILRALKPDFTEEEKDRFMPLMGAGPGGQ